MSVPLSKLRDNLQSRLQLTKAKTLTFGLFVLWEVVIDVIGIDYNIWLRLIVAATVIISALVDQSIYILLKARFPKIMSPAYKLLIVVIVIWLIWPRYEHWLGQTTDRVVLPAGKIASCGGSVSALDGRISIAWVGCGSRDGFCFEVDDLESKREDLRHCFKVGETWEFEVANNRYSMAIAHWPDKKNDTATIRLVQVFNSDSPMIADTSTITALPRDTCMSYNVTFKELEIYDYRDAPADSMLLLFVASPHVCSMWISIDTVGVYPLSVDFDYVATKRGNLSIAMVFISPKVAGYYWPDVRASWKRNDPLATGIHVDTAANKYITFVLKYDIECDTEL